MNTPDKLDELLQRSSAWLTELRDGRLDKLEITIAEHNQALMDYMEGRQIATMSREQQEKLQQLLANTQTASEWIKEQKQSLVTKVAGIRNGRKLRSTYNNSSL